MKNYLSLLLLFPLVAFGQSFSPIINFGSTKVGDVPVNIPIYKTFYAVGTPTVTWIKPDQSTATVTPYNLTNAWLASFTPATVGEHTLVINSPQFRHQFTWKVTPYVPGLEAWNVQQLQPQLVVAAPTNTVAFPGVSTINGALNGTRAVINNTSKYLIPWSGWVYGCIANQTSMYPSNISTWRFGLFSRSGNTFTFKSATPYLSATNSSAVVTYYFPYPLWASMGDTYGYEVTCGNPRDNAIPITSGLSFTSQHAIHYRTSGGFATGDFTTYDLTMTNRLLHIYPIMQNPMVSIAGHSIMSGGSATASMWTDSTTAYTATSDPAYWVEQWTGLSCANVSVSGSLIRGWNGAEASYYMTFNYLKPGLVIFDTHYNDAGRITNTWSGNYYSYLSEYDRLCHHCDTNGVQLALAEGYVPKYALVTSGNADVVQKMQDTLKVWASASGLLWIPQSYRLGQFNTLTNGELAASYGQRWQARTNFAGVADYDYGDGIHLTATGQKVQARALVDGLAKYPRDHSAWGLGWKANVQTNTVAP